MVSKSHPLSELSAISLATLAKTDMLDRLNCEMRDVLHGTCADHGHELYAAYRSNRVDWLVELARQGSGADPASHRYSFGHGPGVETHRWF